MESGGRRRQTTKRGGDRVELDLFDLKSMVGC